MSASEPFSSVVEGVGRAEALMALRDRLAVAIDGAEPRELPALAKQYAEVLREIDSLPAVEANPLDDLRARRAREAAASA